VNLKLTLTIQDKDTDEVLFTNFAMGESNDQRSLFEEAEIQLATIERHLPDFIGKRQAEETERTVDATEGVGEEKEHGDK
jgi:hypothetical protein